MIRVTSPPFHSAMTKPPNSSFQYNAPVTSSAPLAATPRTPYASSPSSLAVLGYRPEEMTGCSAVDFIHHADLEPTRNEMRLARRGKELRNFETRYVAKDGRIVPLVWSGVWSETAQRHFFIGRDMTEHNRLVETERQIRDMLTAVIDASPVAIFCLAPDRTVMMWSRSAERIFGYTAEETVGKPYRFHGPVFLRNTKDG